MVLCATAEAATETGYASQIAARKVETPMEKAMGVLIMMRITNVNRRIRADTRTLPFAEEFAR